MIISIDFDDTYTKDPDFWDEVCKLAIQKKHTVYCVSARYEKYMPKVRTGLLLGKILASVPHFSPNVNG